MLELALGRVFYAKKHLVAWVARTSLVADAIQRGTKEVSSWIWIGNEKSMFFRHMTINSRLALSNKKSLRAAFLGGPARNA